MFPRFPYCQRQAHERFPETARIAQFYSAFVSSFCLCRLFPYGLSVTSLPIGEPLTDDALHGSFGALHVIYAEPNAIAIAEIKFRKIAMQMFLSTMLIDALHAAFENRIVALDGVGVDRLDVKPVGHRSRLHYERTHLRCV